MILIKAAVVIPIYKEELNDLEKISLAQVRKVLKNYPMIFVGPEGKNFSYLEPGEMLVQFHPQYFKDVIAYSQLLLQPFFYEPFLPFDYILIYQLDAFVFYDALEDFCRLGYDYIGAAWPYHSWPIQKAEGKTPRVGNGGFSLRKVKAFHKLLMESPALLNLNHVLNCTFEDDFFAMCGINYKTYLNVAPVEVAECFSMEWYPERHVKKLGRKLKKEYFLPFGCHNWHDFSADFYVELFSKLGYDLRPFRSQMSDKNYEFYLPLALETVAIKRMIRDLYKNKSLLKCLPTKNFASVRVVQSKNEMKVLLRIIAEENSLFEKTFVYGSNNLFAVVNEISKEKLPHLILVIDYIDDPLIEEIEKKGLVYGRHVLSFRREYIKSKEKFLHSLGR